MSVFDDERPGEQIPATAATSATPERGADMLLALHASIVDLNTAIAALAGGVEELVGPAAQPFSELVTDAPQLARGGACKVTWLHAANELNAVDAYLQLFDEYNPDAPSLGYTKPAATLWLPASGGLDDPWIPPIMFRKGIVVAATSNRDGSGAALAHPVLVNLTTKPAR